jgi:cysteinyl-tRNA synthetase
MPFDIHTGGIDHREIHHPNEIAQNQAYEGCADSGARIWMHNNFLVERSGKMSKSSGEFLRLQLLIDKGFHPLAYRLMCLQAHYRSELEFSWEGLQAAFVRLKRMVAALDVFNSLYPSFIASYERHGTDVAPWTSNVVQEHKQLMLMELPQQNEKFGLAVLDDLNTARALVEFEAILKNIGFNKYLGKNLRDTIVHMDSVLGLNLFNISRTDLRIRPKAATITEEEIETALLLRKEARASKDFATSDRIRDDLIAKGVEVMDGDPLGWDWKLAI